jgi:hypothetical protein
MGSLSRPAGKENYRRLPRIVPKRKVIIYEVSPSTPFYLSEFATEFAARNIVVFGQRLGRIKENQEAKKDVYAPQIEPIKLS